MVKLTQSKNTSYARTDETRDNTAIKTALRFTAANTTKRDQLSRIEYNIIKTKRAAATSQRDHSTNGKNP